MPVFIPQSGCAHRCVFCNQRAITGTAAALPDFGTLEQEIRRFLGYRREGRARTEISFFGGNFLGQDPGVIKKLLDAASGFVRAGEVDGIRFSTRPDTVDEKGLDLLSGYPVSTVEIGAQSMDERVLALAKRGHSSEDTVRAVALLQKRGYDTGLQMMVGLPGENDHSAMASGRRIAALSPDFVRIYPTLVIKGSLLEKWYASGRYTPLSLDRCMEQVQSLFRLFSEKNIPVARIGLQANEGLDTGRDLVAGPYHPAMGQMVASGVFFDKAAACIEASGDDFGEGIDLVVHPRMISTMRGQKNSNILRLKRHFPHLGPVNVIGDPGMSEASVAVVKAENR
ncbi:MAG: elongator complex protein 3 [Thermodesulfobacteriota bacterium]